MNTLLSIPHLDCDFYVLNMHVWLLNEGVCWPDGACVRVFVCGEKEAVCVNYRWGNGADGQLKKGRKQRPLRRDFWLDQNTTPNSQDRPTAASFM